MIPAQANAVRVATNRSIGRPLTPTQIPAAARNLTSPRPRPWTFLKVKKVASTTRRWIQWPRPQERFQTGHWTIDNHGL
jgi:hypothetical protein